MTDLGFVFDLAVWDNPSANDLIDSLLNQRSADSLRESHGHADKHAGFGATSRLVSSEGCRFPEILTASERLWTFDREEVIAHPDRGFTNAELSRSPRLFSDVAGFDNRFLISAGWY